MRNSKKLRVSQKTIPLQPNSSWVLPTQPSLTSTCTPVSPVPTSPRTRFSTTSSSSTCISKSAKGSSNLLRLCKLGLNFSPFCQKRLRIMNTQRRQRRLHRGQRWLCTCLLLIDIESLTILEDMRINIIIIYRQLMGAVQGSQMAGGTGYGMGAAGMRTKSYATQNQQHSSTGAHSANGKQPMSDHKSLLYPTSVSTDCESIVDINSLLVYYGSDKAKQDFHLQEAQQRQLLKDSLIPSQDQVWQTRGLTEFKKGPNQMGQSLMVKRDGNKLTDSENPLAKSAYSNNRQSTQIVRNQSEYNPRWGATSQYKVVRDVDTSGGKYQQPLTQSRNKLMQSLGFQNHQQRGADTTTATENPLLVSTSSTGSSPNNRGKANAAPQQFEIKGFLTMTSSKNNNDESGAMQMDHFDKQFLNTFLRIKFLMNIAIFSLLKNSKNVNSQNNDDRQQKKVQDEIVKNFGGDLQDENEIEAVRQAVKEFREELIKKRKEKMMKKGENSPQQQPMQQIWLKISIYFEFKSFQSVWISINLFQQNQRPPQEPVASIPEMLNETISSDENLEDEDDAMIQSDESEHEATENLIDENPDMILSLLEGGGVNDDAQMGMIYRHISFRASKILEKKFKGLKSKSTLQAYNGGGKKKINEARFSQQGIRDNSESLLQKKDIGRIRSNSFKLGPRPREVKDQVRKAYRRNSLTHQQSILLSDANQLIEVIEEPQVQQPVPFILEREQEIINLDIIPIIEDPLEENNMHTSISTSTTIQNNHVQNNFAEIRIGTDTVNKIRMRYLRRLTKEQIWLAPMKQPKSSQNLVIFDWDDTLFPTTYLNPVLL